MAFPSSPTNGQSAIVNGISYSYSSTDNAWTRVTAINLTLSSNLTVGNIFANGNIRTTSTTTSTSTTTGALVVAGGAGIAGNVYMDKLYTTNGLYWSGNGNVIVTGGGATLGFPNSTVAVFPTGDYGNFTATKDAFGVHIDTTYDLMEPIGSYSTTDLNS